MTPDPDRARRRVIFAPDWRAECYYQRPLAEALAAHGVDVEFLSWYRRGFPLLRGTRDIDRTAILHLHWLNPYVGRAGLLNVPQTFRFPCDLAAATRKRPLVVTAHNLYPHNRHGERLVRWAVQRMYRRADRIIAHSPAAREQILEKFGIDPARVAVIPIGPATDQLGLPADRIEARQRLKLDPSESLCLMCGVIDEYKGIEEVLDFWQQHAPNVRLAVVGKPKTAAYGDFIARRMQAIRGATLRPEFLSTDELRDWISAADVCLFNYRDILTSGSILIPRGWGIPILLPARLTTLDLGEPDPRVVRFNSFADDFATCLKDAIETRPNYETAAAWRAATSWDAIARRTAELYAELS